MKISKAGIIIVIKEKECFRVWLENEESKERNK
jgi:hypothetical protein